MYSYKIIKSAEVRDSLCRVLTLRRFSNTGEQQFNDAGENVIALEEELEESINLHTEAVAQAEEILNEARAAADEIIRQARQDSEIIKQEASHGAQLESEQIKQKAYQDACDQGYQDGYREGAAKAKEEGDAIREQALDVLRQAEDCRRRTITALEEEIISLAREIAEKLLAVQLSLDPQIIFNVAMESLRLVADRQQVVLYINPAELALYEKRREQLLHLLPAKAELQVITDAGVHLGGCRVETEHGTVDATVETRREALLKALYGEGA